MTPLGIYLYCMVHKLSTKEFSIRFNQRYTYTDIIALNQSLTELRSLDDSSLIDRLTYIAEVNNFSDEDNLYLLEFIIPNISVLRKSITLVDELLESNTNTNTNIDNILTNIADIETTIKITSVLLNEGKLDSSSIKMLNTRLKYLDRKLSSKLQLLDKEIQDDTRK